MTQHKDKSITELEIIAALKYSKCTRAFFYFRDADYMNKKFPNGPTEVRHTTFLFCVRVLCTGFVCGFCMRLLCTGFVYGFCVRVLIHFLPRFCLLRIFGLIMQPITATLCQDIDKTNKSDIGEQIKKTDERLFLDLNIFSLLF